MRLTENSRRFVEANYLPVLDAKTPASGDGLLDLLAKGSTKFRPNDRNRALFKVVAKVLRRKFSSAERNFCIRHLVDGGPTDPTGRGQRLLVKALQTTFGIEEWRLTPLGVSDLAKLCRSDAPGTTVGGGLLASRVSLPASPVPPRQRPPGRR